jgi:threonine dehydrogenase-like Zn-dependent dehydrogenase
MKALTWQGNTNVEVFDVPDPVIEEATDVIITVTSTAICGSDLHLYGVLGPYLKPGDILGHEAMGVVAEVGPGVETLDVGDRVVIPFNISCGHCWMCERQLYAQCETTQVRSEGKGAALFGYTSLYGSVPGGQAEYLRVPQAQFGPIKVPDGPPDEHFLYLSDILPTAWQAVRYADTPPGGGPWPCWASDRSASSRPGSDACWGPAESSASTGCPNAGRWPTASTWRPSTSTSWTTPQRRSST